MLQARSQETDANSISPPATQGGETPSIKQSVDFEALSRLMHGTTHLIENINERLQGGAKGGVHMNGGRISGGLRLKQQMEEVCALKKKLEDLEPVMKKAVIMAEPEPARDRVSSK